MQRFPINLIASTRRDEGTVKQCEKRHGHGTENVSYDLIHIAYGATVDVSILLDFQSDANLCMEYYLTSRARFQKSWRGHSSLTEETPLFTLPSLTIGNNSCCRFSSLQ